MTAVAWNRIHVRRKRWGLALVAVLLGLFVFAVVYGKRQLERDALRRMDPTERRALYESTLRSTEALCSRASAEPALSERCLSEAEFLARFPECDAQCMELVRKHRREATR